ncbi:MAG: CLC_0170 family protein [Alkaliphilus sp.]
MNEFVETFGGIYDVHMLVLLIIISIFLIYVDIPRLKKANLTKDIMIARGIATIYILVGITTYILLQIT